MTNNFKDRADSLRQNFALGQMSREFNPDKKVEVAAQAGVSNPQEMASLLNRKLEPSDRRKMFQTLMWGNNPVDHPAFEREFKEWEKTQNWE